MATLNLPRHGTRRAVPAVLYSRRNPPIITLPLGDRRQIELAIEALLAVLDHRDGDPDLECNGDPEDQSEDEGAQCDDEGFGR